MALRLSTLGPRARKVLRYAGFVVLGLVTFVFAFQMTFPFDRVKDKAIELLSEKYEVSIGGVERGFLPGRMYWKAVSLRTRPAKAEEVATTFYIEQLEIDLGLFALLHGTAQVKFDAKFGPSHLKGQVSLSKEATSIEIAGEDLPSASLPVREALGLPMSGKIHLAFELHLPNEKTKAGKVSPTWTKAEGSAELDCPSNCTVGDGKTKLKFNVTNKSQQAFAENGIDFGKVNIETLHAALEIKDGKMTITKFDTKSGDGELHVDFEMTLNQDLNQSMVTGCLRFNGSAALLKREPKTHAAISTTGAPLGPDNLFHIKLDGPLRQIRRLGQVCGAASGKNTDNPGGATARPNLTVTPDVPVKPPGAGTFPVPVPPPPPVQPPPPAAVPEDAGNTGNAVIDALHIPTPIPEGELAPPVVAPPPIQNGAPTEPTPRAGP
ncbi:MAG TPA: type II secretion system protein GspN [Kofleriaceae bacterium]|jgi:type II secretion system protein N|nr:type II secretion system protein GspN [Kofleriaceae bacterium]